MVADNSINNDYSLSYENKDVLVGKDLKEDLPIEVGVSCVVYSPAWFKFSG